MEKLTTNKLGQWSLVKEETSPSEPPVVYEDNPGPKPGTMSHMQQLEVYLHENFGGDIPEIKSEPYTPESYGRKLDIKPEDVAHIDNFPGGEEGFDKAVDNGHVDYDYARGMDGRIYMELFSRNKKFNHIHNKFLATNRHESEQKDDPPTLTGCENMGVVFKPRKERLKVVKHSKKDKDLIK